MEVQELVKKFERQLQTHPYLYMNQLCSALNECIRQCHIQRLTSNVVYAFKTAVCNVFFGGCSPDFESEESWRRWDEFTIDNLVFQPEQVAQSHWSSDSNPHQDKTVPYVQLKQLI